MSSSGGHYGGDGDWNQSDDPWGQGQPTPPQPSQGESAWVSPTQEWSGGNEPPQQGGPTSTGSWDAGPPAGSQQWDTGPPPAQWDTMAPGAQPPGQQPPPQGGQPTQAPGYDFGGQQPPPQQGYDFGGPPPQQPFDPGGGPPGYGPPPPPKKSNKGLIIGLSAGGGGLVLILVIIVIIVVAVNAGGGGGGGGGGGTGASRSAAWKVPEPVSEGESDTSALFASKDNKSLIRVSNSSVTAYGVSNGKQSWNIGVPTGSKICASTKEAPDDVVGIIYGSNSRCTTVAGIDVATGKQLWSDDFKLSDPDFPPLSASVAAGSGSLYISTTESVFKYDAKTGTTQAGASPKDDTCDTSEAVPTSDGGLLSLLDCTDSLTFTKLNSSLKDTTWSTSVDAESSSDVAIMNADPPVLQVGNASDNGELRVFDTSGKQTQVIQSRDAKGSLNLRSSFSTASFNDMRKEFPVKIVGNTLLGTTDTTSSTDTPPSVVGINLTTGQRSFNKQIGGGGESSSSRSLTWVTGGSAKEATVIDNGDYDTKPQIDTFNTKGTVKKGDKLDTGDSVSFGYGSDRAISIGKYLILAKSNPSDSDPLLTAYKA